MPYTTGHKAHTRARIVAAARTLFNRRGFTAVSIDEIMQAAGLTRGGFYNHFARKDELYAEAVSHILGCEPGCHGRPRSFLGVQQIITSYLSDRQLLEVDDACPLVAFPSDVARGGEAVKRAYGRVLSMLIDTLQSHLGDRHDARTRAVTMATLCVGGMLLARAVDDPTLNLEIREAALQQALQAGGLQYDAACRLAA